MDYTHLLDQAIEILKPAAPAGHEIATKVAANALWDWIKAKFSRRSAAAAAAVVEIDKAPANETNWEVLRLQLRKAIEEDGGLRKELEEIIGKCAPRQCNSQRSTVTGHGNVVTQIIGKENTGSAR